jgi:hypothetical protein
MEETFQFSFENEAEMLMFFILPPGCGSPPFQTGEFIRL